jgi:alpha-glucosidase
LIGEIYLPFERLAAYYGKDLSGAHLPFNFSLIHAAWNATAIAGLIEEYEASLPPGGWPNWVLGNHDQARIAERVGLAQARIAAMLLLTLRGTPTMYYGDEIGLPGVDVPPDRVQDPWEKREPGLNVGRDPSRTPMQWDATANAGFSRGRAWLPVEKDFPTRTVAAQQADARSILMLTRTLIALRNTSRALRIGAQRIVSARENVLLFERSHAEECFLIALNFAAEDRTLERPMAGKLVASTHMDRAELGRATLRGGEGIVLRLD